MNSVVQAEKPACFPYARKAAKERNVNSLVSDGVDETWVDKRSPSAEVELWAVPPEEIITSRTMVSEAKRRPLEPSPLLPERPSPEL